MKHEETPSLNEGQTTYDLCKNNMLNEKRVLAFMTVLEYGIVCLRDIVIVLERIFLGAYNNIACAMMIKNYSQSMAKLGYLKIGVWGDTFYLTEEVIPHLEYLREFYQDYKRFCDRTIDQVHGEWSMRDRAPDDLAL